MKRRHLKVCVWDRLVKDIAIDVAAFNSLHIESDHQLLSDKGDDNPPRGQPTKDGGMR